LPAGALAAGAFANMLLRMTNGTATSAATTTNTIRIPRIHFHIFFTVNLLLYTSEMIACNLQEIMQNVCRFHKETVDFVAGAGFLTNVPGKENIMLS
jgi:hypothetical protein